MRILYFSLALASVSLANDGASNVKQPWSAYNVHQMDRPHPEKVAGGTCVTTPAPSDAVVVFDGKNTDAFTVPWIIRDGMLIADASDTHTKQHFGSCQLHIEWRVPANGTVKGQKGGNSGVYLMDRYEVQVQESHTNVTYADGQVAAIYGQTPPSVNASLPRGEWQSYDIIFTAPTYGENGVETPAYITVIHNGIVVHNHTEIYGKTTHQKVAQYESEHPERAPIRLQWHNDPVEFRNIWVRPLD